MNLEQAKQLNAQSKRNFLFSLISLVIALFALAMTGCENTAKDCPICYTVMVVDRDSINADNEREDPTWKFDPAFQGQVETEIKGIYCQDAFPTYSVIVDSLKLQMERNPYRTYLATTCDEKVKL